jgi:hypothetical protein
MLQLNDMQLKNKKGTHCYYSIFDSDICKSTIPREFIVALKFITERIQCE